jgi:hypothetical protein
VRRKSTNAESKAYKTSRFSHLERLFDVTALLGESGDRGVLEAIDLVVPLQSISMLMGSELRSTSMHGI